MSMKSENPRATLKVKLFSPSEVESLEANLWQDFLKDGAEGGAWPLVSSTCMVCYGD